MNASFNEFYNYTFNSKLQSETSAQLLRAENYPNQRIWQS